MRKIVKKMFVVFMAMILSLSCFACNSGSTVIEEIDKTKKQIYVSVYNGGYGHEWVKSLKADFEKDHPEYQIMLSTSKDVGQTINSIIKTKQGTYNIYISGDYRFTKDLIDLDCLVDLSDIYSSKAESSDSKTVEQKIKNSNVYKKAYSKQDGTGVYTIPYSSGFTGIVFDYDLFVENGWLEFATEANDGVALSAQGIRYTPVAGKLEYEDGGSNVNYSVGDVILTAGRDGKYGTYDDGQPTTISAFESMLAKIKASSIYNPFIYSTKNADYVDNITNSIFATYEGEENFAKFYSFDGSYSNNGSSFLDGGKQSVAFDITPETGYKTYKMVGIEVGTKFMHDYVSNASNYADVVKNGLTYEEAQNYYVLGYQSASQSNKAGAMLVEGLWWENETRVTFDSAASRDESKGYGKREYRYLVYPYIDGQYGIDGTGKGTIYTTLEDGLIFIDKNATDPSLINICKEFVKYTCRDKYLIEAAKIGCIRPFDFDVSSALSGMTPFVRNINEMIADTENIKVLSMPGYIFSSDLSTYGITEATSRISTFTSFNKNPSRTTAQSVNDGYNGAYSTWGNYIAKMQTALGK